MQELLDEIERNMQRTNGRLDEPLLNKLVKYLTKKIFVANCFERSQIFIDVCHYFVQQTYTDTGLLEL